MGKTNHNLLTAKTVSSRLDAGRHSDGGGLYLQVSKTGAKSWLFLFRWEKKQKEMGLGSASVVTLLQARELGRLARQDMEAGRNPLIARRQREEAEAAAQRATMEKPTFEVFGLEMIESWASEWKSPKSKGQWIKTVLHYCAAIKDMRVSDIDTQAVLSVLKPIWSKIWDTAKKVRERIERILDAAKVAGHRTTDNPARWRGHLALMLPKRPKGHRQHHKALHYAVVKDFIRDLRGIEITRMAGNDAIEREQEGSMSALALEFLILTAARTTEVRMARKCEFDLAAAVWTIPKERMKNTKEHRVPLSPRAVAILRHVWPLSNHPESFVFKGQSRVGCLSQQAMDMCKRGLIGMTATVHGFRTSFRNWCKELARVERELAELCLSHRVGDDSEQAYSRGDALELRRPIMQDWAIYIDPT